MSLYRKWCCLHCIKHYNEPQPMQLQDTEQHECALTHLIRAIVWRDTLAPVHHCTIHTAAARLTDHGTDRVWICACPITTLTFRVLLAFNVTYCMNKGCILWRVWIKVIKTIMEPVYTELLFWSVNEDIILCKNHIFD